MKYQTKETIKIIIFLLYMCGVWFSGFFIGKNTIKTVTITEKVLISDELSNCTEKGGEYALFFSNVSQKYIEKCYSPEKEIFLNEIN